MRTITVTLTIQEADALHAASIARESMLRRRARAAATGAEQVADERLADVCAAARRKIEEAHRS